jgi:hypothetical protein
VDSIELFPASEGFFTYHQDSSEEKPNATMSFYESPSLNGSLRRSQQHHGDNNEFTMF